MTALCPEDCRHMACEACSIRRIGGREEVRCDVPASDAIPYAEHLRRKQDPMTQEECDRTVLEHAVRTGAEAQQRLDAMDRDVDDTARSRMSDEQRAKLDAQEAKENAGMNAARAGMIRRNREAWKTPAAQPEATRLDANHHGRDNSEAARQRMITRNREVWKGSGDPSLGAQRR